MLCISLFFEQTVLWKREKNFIKIVTGEDKENVHSQVRDVVSYELLRVVYFYFKSGKQKKSIPPLGLLKS